MTTEVETGKWLTRARDLAAMVEQYREEGERERCLPQPVLAAARAAGFQWLLLPRALGGGQAELSEALQVAEELGRQDGSMGWNLTFLILAPLFSDYLPEATARAIFGGHDAIVAGSDASTSVRSIHDRRLPADLRLRRPRTSERTVRSR